MDSSTIPILLIEDDQHDIELTLAAFKFHAATTPIDLARDGEQAVDYFARCESQLAAGKGVLPRLVLLDLNLPKVTGREILKRIKNNPRLKIIPVIVLTSSPAEEDMLTSYQNGANGYLQKPVSFDEFRCVVKEIIGFWLNVNLQPLAALQPVDPKCAA